MVSVHRIENVSAENEGAATAQVVGLADEMAHPLFRVEIDTLELVSLCVTTIVHPPPASTRIVGAEMTMIVARDTGTFAKRDQLVATTETHTEAVADLPFVSTA